MKAILPILLLLFSGIRARESTSLSCSCRRTECQVAPSLKAKISHVMKQGEIVGVFEVKNGWARISEYYPASFERENGASA